MEKDHTFNKFHFDVLLSKLYRIIIYNRLNKSLPHYTTSIVDTSCKTKIPSEKSLIMLKYTKHLVVVSNCNTRVCSVLVSEQTFFTRPTSRWSC